MGEDDELFLDTRDSRRLHSKYFRSADRPISGSFFRFDLRLRPNAAFPKMVRGAIGGQSSNLDSHLGE